MTSKLNGLLVIALLWRGEQIAMRAKAVIKSFED